MKTLRPNPVAQRELRLFGKYRVLFNVDEVNEEVTIMLVETVPAVRATGPEMK